MFRIAVPLTVAATFCLASVAAPDRALAQNFVPFAALAGNESAILVSGQPVAPAPRLAPATQGKPVIASRQPAMPTLPEGPQMLPYIAPVVSDTVNPANSTP